MGDPITDILLMPRVLLSLVLSGALGWEREAKGRPAGLRTHMLVGISATLIVILTDIVMRRTHVTPGEQVFDPIRCIEATVAGISFLGAGTIFVARDDRVRGLTTAASLLATGAVGLAVGFQHYVLAGCTTAVLLLVIVVLGRLEGRLSGAAPAEIERRS